jgi:diketogulonate reductase-like aldo/keto reductase
MMTINLNIHTLGKGAVPAMGFGTWRLGGARERDFANDDARDIDAIRTALELGLRHIDTAEMYAAGHAETLVAEAIKDQKRDTLYLASKVMGKNLRYDDVHVSARRSLERLKTDYLDLLYVHFPNPEVPMEETFRAFDELVAEKLVRAIAVSNFSLERLKRSREIAQTPISAIQVHYNLKYREPERAGLLRYCAENDIAVIAWRPVQFGELVEAPASVLQEVAKRYGKTPAQVAINWLLSQHGVGTLFMSRRREHIVENLGALGWNLSNEDIELLRSGFPGQEERSDRAPLT